MSTSLEPRDPARLPRPDFDWEPSAPGGNRTWVLRTVHGRLMHARIRRDLVNRRWRETHPAPTHHSFAIDVAIAPVEQIVGYSREVQAELREGVFAFRPATGTDDRATTLPRGTLLRLVLVGEDPHHEGFDLLCYEIVDGPNTGMKVWATANGRWPAAACIVSSLVVYEDEPILGDAEAAALLLADLRQITSDLQARIQAGEVFPEERRRLKPESLMTRVIRRLVSG